MLLSSLVFWRLSDMNNISCVYSYGLLSVKEVFLYLIRVKGLAKDSNARTAKSSSTLSKVLKEIDTDTRTDSFLKNFDSSSNTVTF